MASIPPQNPPAANQKRCQTCKERKIKCDGALPTCRNCQKSRRECRAADKFALSWPAPKSRRFLEGPKGRRSYLKFPENRGENGRHFFHFVNVYFDYAEAHYLLPHVRNSRVRQMLFNRDFGLPEEYSIFKQNFVKQPGSLYADIERHQAGSTDWMGYFYHEASTSLPHIDTNPAEFRDLLLRMSLQDDSPSSKAVLYAIFCLASLKRYGNAQESIHFKSLALKALQESTQKENMTIARTLQHVAAGLILCRAEIALGDDSTVFWGLYICNLRTIFNDTFNSDPARFSVEGSDAAILFRYVLYHEVLSKFSLGHWRRPSYISGQLKVNFKGQLLEFHCRYPLNSLDTHQLKDYMQVEMLLLSRILDTSKIEESHMNAIEEELHRETVDELERNLEQSLGGSKKVFKQIVKTTDDNGAEDVEIVANPTMALELQRYLFLCACWIYFQRTCRHLTGPSPEIEKMLDEIFAVNDDYIRLDVRVMPFSLFLIGSEANTDERRRSVLDLVQSRLKTPVCCGSYPDTETERRANLAHSECLLSAVWSQDDLADSTQGYPDYVTKMQWVITARPILPALV